MKANGILFITLGCLILAGGSAGFILKGSLPSLLSGLIIGPLLVLCGKKTISQSVLSETLGLVFTFALDLFFTYRLLKTGVFIPAGIFIALSSSIIILVCLNIRKRVNRIPSE